MVLFDNCLWNLQLVKSYRFNGLIPILYDSLSSNKVEDTSQNTNKTGHEE